MPVVAGSRCDGMGSKRTNNAKGKLRFLSLNELCCSIAIPTAQASGSISSQMLAHKRSPLASKRISSAYIPSAYSAMLRFSILPKHGAANNAFLHVTQCVFVQHISRLQAAEQYALFLVTLGAGIGTSPLCPSLPR